jgi:hypothetical protein
MGSLLPLPHLSLLLRQHSLSGLGVALPACKACCA